MTILDVHTDEIDHLPYEDDRQLPHADDCHVFQMGETTRRPTAWEFNAKMKEFQSKLGNVKFQGQID